MEGFSIEVGKMRLPEDEGELAISSRSYDPGYNPKAEFVDSWDLNSENVSSLNHDTSCGGKVDFVKVSQKKSVLHCAKCGLRIKLSPEVKTVADLRKALEK